METISTIVYDYKDKKCIPIYTVKTIVPVSTIVYEWGKRPEMKLMSTVGVGVGVGVRK